MKQSKKVRTVMMVAMLSLILAACGSEKKDTKEMKEQTTTSSTQQMDDNMVTMNGVFKAEMNNKTSGNVEIKDNKIMLTEFITEEGPDVHIWLTEDGDMKDGYDIAKVDLKEMNQTFELKQDLDDDYNTVVIYCNDAHSVFATAPLSMMK